MKEKFRPNLPGSQYLNLRNETKLEYDTGNLPGERMWGREKRKEGRERENKKDERGEEEEQKGKSGKI